MFLPNYNEIELEHEDKSFILLHANGLLIKQNSSFFYLGLPVGKIA